MNCADSYQRGNSLQRRDAKQIIDEFRSTIQWRNDGHDSVLDIGCGSGDVMIDLLLPTLPLNFSRLIGVDISEKMIRACRQTYPMPKIEFDRMDIAGDISKFNRTTEPFDHITSFYCLHWIQDQKKAIQNIYNLLAADGDCLLVFLAQNPVYEVYKILANDNRWSEYMTDVDSFISPYQDSSDPASDFGSILYASNFAEYNVQVREKIFSYDSVEALKKAVKAINPFFERIPMHEHDAFFEAYKSVVIDLGLRSIDGQNKERFFMSYKLMIAYARK